MAKDVDVLIKTEDKPEVDNVTITTTVRSIVRQQRQTKRE